MKNAFSHLRIIIRQEYRKEHRHSKEVSHADYEKCAEVFTLIHSPDFVTQKIFIL